MSSETQEMLDIFEKLPEAKRSEMTDFGRFLLAQNERTTGVEATQRWLATARGAAKQGIATEAIMALTRGEL
jgi:hypothetical protein